MEKVFNNVISAMVFWQIIVLVLSIALVYCIMKLYKKWIKDLE